MKIQIMCIGLLIVALLWVGIIVKSGWDQAVELMTHVFYQKVEFVPVNVPKGVSVEVLIRRTFGKDAKMALAVSHAENGTRVCDRVSVTGDVGVFQISYKWHHKKGNLFDCQDNIRVAKEIYRASGWNAWTTYKSGAYKQFLYE